jgi:hypothetical protein
VQKRLRHDQMPAQHSDESKYFATTRRRMPN